MCSRPSRDTSGRQALQRGEIALSPQLQTGRLKRLSAPLSRQEQTGFSAVADSPNEVRVRVREQLLLGATQIKLTAGGGAPSPNSPLEATTFTEPELRAAVEAAENWGTYVAVHADTPTSIQRAIPTGVKCIDHCTCGTKPCWRALKSGFLYNNKALTAPGVAQINLAGSLTRVTASRQLPARPARPGRCGCGPR